MTESPLPPLPAEFTINLTSEIYPLHSGEQLPLGLLGDDIPCMYATCTSICMFADVLCSMYKNTRLHMICFYTFVL